MEILLLLLLGGGAFFFSRARQEREKVGDAAWSLDAQPLAAPMRTAEDVALHRVVLALGRVEARRLAAHPALVMGVVFAVPILLLQLDGSLPETSEWLGATSRLLPLFLFPFYGMVVLASHWAASRPRRDGTEELLGALPSSAEARTLGLVLATAGPMVAAGGLLAAHLGAAVRGGIKISGTSLWEAGLPPVVGGVEPWSIVAALLLVVCAGALGIGLARLVPHAVAPLGALLAVAFISAKLAEEGTPGILKALAPMQLPKRLPSYLAAWHPLAHIGALLGMASLAIGIALWRDGLGRRSIGVIAAALALMTAGAVGQTLPMSDQAAVDRAAALGGDGMSDQVCAELEGHEVCAFPEFAELRDDWAAVTATALAIVPPRAPVHGLPIVQRVTPAEIERLPDEVIDRLDPPSLRTTPHVWPASIGIHPTLRWRGEVTELELALQVATAAVGLPAGPGADGRPCFVGGQARAVVALLLRAVSVEHGRDDRVYSVPDQENEIGENFYGGAAADLLPPHWDTDQRAAVVFGVGDLTAMRVLWDVDADDLAAVLDEHWEELVDPMTPTSALGAALGVSVDDSTDPVPDGLRRCA